MYECHGRFCELKELSTYNEEELFKLMYENASEYSITVSGEHIPDSMSEFRNMLEVWFLSGRNYQFLVYSKKGEVVGTIFLYGWNQEARQIKLSCYFTPDNRMGLIVPEALGLSLEFISAILGVHEILFDVYEENQTMHKLAIKIGAVTIGQNMATTRFNKIVYNYYLPHDAITLLLTKLTSLETKYG